MSRIRTLLMISLFIFTLALPSFAQEASEVTHVVQSGENLFRIALRYGVDMNELATSNGITDSTRIFAGQVLVIPGLKSADSGDVVDNPLIAAAPIIHTVQRGEYLGQIAALYGVTIDNVLQGNQITNANTIYPGQELQIWASNISTLETAAESEPANSAVESVASTEAPIEMAIHVVAPGEYLSQIAQGYGVAWTAIAEANQISNPNQIYAGMQLNIPGGNNVAVQSPVTVAAIASNIADPGAHWGYGREIVVDLSSQMTYAYQDGNLVFSALVSTGLPATPTVQGEFQMWHRTPEQTMSGPGYYLPNVKWVQYFYQGYGFHGTYWHSNFGQPMSHGCVNMTNEDAEWLYNFASIGTNVFVQY
jgi:LysM repeat protein